MAKGAKQKKRVGRDWEKKEASVGDEGEWDGVFERQAFVFSATYKVSHPNPRKGVATFLYGGGVLLIRGHNDLDLLIRGRDLLVRGSRHPYIQGEWDGVFERQAFVFSATYKVSKPKPS